MDECSVCLTARADTPLDCKHSFCQECVSRLEPGAGRVAWSSFPNCPLCRATHVPIHPRLKELSQPLKDKLLTIEFANHERLKSKGMELFQAVKDVLAKMEEIRQCVEAIQDINMESARIVQIVIAFATPDAPMNGAMWSPNGFLFQSMLTCPPSTGDIAENVLRRDLALYASHLSDEQLLLHRFGLYPPPLLHTSPEPVGLLQTLFAYYYTKGWSNPRTPITNGTAILDFYGDAENAAWFYDNPISPVATELTKLVADSWANRLLALCLARTTDAESCALFFTEYERFHYEAKPAVINEFNAIINANMPMGILATPKKCAGCHRRSPAHCLYTARRAGEPRRVRCEGCVPRASWGF